MKIQPVKVYKPPAYPTYLESKQDARLLERLPRRWWKNDSIASLIGTGFFMQVVCAGCDNDAAPATANREIAAPQNPGPERTGVARAARTSPITRVAPILEDALANDGRGGFGCVAISAPVFLSEDEALDLIQTELKKAGLKMQKSVSIDGLPVPSTPQSREERVKEMVEEMKKADWEEKIKPRVTKLEKGSYAFDLGTADKSLAVAFLNGDDLGQWKAETGFWSSVRSHDFAWLATQVRDAFAQRDEGDPVIIGLFFEPSTYPLRDRDSDFRGLNDEQRLARYQTETKDTKERAREKLRVQVLHFVEYLKKEGVVE